MRESRIGRLRCWMTGGPALPVIELTATAAAMVLTRSISAD